VSAEEIGTALGAALLAALGWLWAAIRRRRRGRAVLPFRARVRAYFSLRSDEPDSRASVEPQPFDQERERDTGRRRRPRELGDDDK